jgi:hypothetical protein
MEVTAELLRQLGPEIQMALVDVGRRLGVGFTVGRASCTGLNATFKLEVGVVGDDGQVATRESESFKSLAPMYGLNDSDLGREFVWRGKLHKIVGLNPKATRFPVLTESCGRKYKASVVAVKSALSPIFGKGKENGDVDIS